MKKNKNNLLIGTVLTICILIPLFYFTIRNTKLNIFSGKAFLNKPNVGLLDNESNKNNFNNANEIIYGDDGTKSSGINHVKVPSIFPKSFSFQNPYVYYRYMQRPNNNSTEAPIAGTIQSPTNNFKPIPKADTTRRISPNLVEVPNSYPKNKTNLQAPTPEKPKENISPKLDNPVVPKENITPKEPAPVPIPSNIESKQPLPSTEAKITKPPVVVENTAPIKPKVENSSKIQSNNITSLSDAEQAIFNQVNIERAKVGLPLLSYNKTMEKYARIKSKDMADKNYFSHEDLQGNLITVQMDKDGVKYKAWGENIASKAGGIDYKKLSDQFMTQWMNSSGHRANILSKDFQSIGVGLYQIGNEVFATQEFYK